MVPRSRGCDTCRQRRIKCDREQPECFQCRKSGRKCPGSIFGPLMVDMRSAAARRAGHRPAEEVKRPTPDHQRTQPSINQREDPSEGGSSSSGDSSYAISIQPSAQPANAEMFFLHFIDYWISHDRRVREFSWLHHIKGPSMNRNDALQLATRAAVTAYCGIQASNWEQLRLAKVMYGDALIAQWRLINSVMRSKEKVIKVIPAALMLSLFESMTASNEVAYRMHVENTSKLLSAISDEDRGLIFMDNLLSQLHAQMMFLNATRCYNDYGNQPSASHILLPTENDGFRAYMQWLLPITEAYGIFVHSCTASWDVATVLDVRRGLEDLWDKQEMFPTQVAQIPPLRPNNSSDLDRYIVALAFAIRTIHFNSARIMLSYMLPPSHQMDDEHNEDYCQSALDAASLVDLKTLGVALLWLVLPMTLVACHSPSVRQRTEALTRLQEWCLAQRTLAMLGSMALQHVNRIYRKEGRPIVVIDSEPINIPSQALARSD